MEKASTPSMRMTDGQIDKITANVRAGLSKRRQNFLVGDVQEAMEVRGLDKEIISAVEKAIEEVVGTIVYIVKVDRNRTPQQVLDATKLVQYTDKSVVSTMPSNGKGIQENVEVVFFKTGWDFDDDKIAKEYEKRGLKPDPYAQAAVNEYDPTFVNEHSNGCHWKGPDNKWRLMFFTKVLHESSVSVKNDDCSGDEKKWDRDYWFGGVRK